MQYKVVFVYFMKDKLDTGCKISNQDVSEFYGTETNLDNIITGLFFSQFNINNYIRCLVANLLFKMFVCLSAFCL